MTHEAFRDGRVSTRFLEEHDVRREVPEVVNAIAEALVARGPRVETKRGIPSVWEVIGPQWGH